VLIGLYAVLGIAGAWYLADTTAIGADLATYQRAGHALWTTGDPWAEAASVPEDFRYRYPPLLAMVIPVLGWPPLWYALIAAATLIPIIVAVRVAGPVGLLPPALLAGAWVQQFLNGNAQAFVVALLVVVPFTGAAGAVGLAVATMVKLHPALAVAWYVGRRDWRCLAWYAGAMAVLALIQLPWLPAMVRFYLNDPSATTTIPGMSLRAIGVVPWVLGTIIALAATGWFAQTRYGWLLAQIVQLIALPRVLMVNLALLLAAPLPRSAPAPTQELQQDRSARLGRMETPPGARETG
jgi:hypothetical protein